MEWTTSSVLVACTSLLTVRLDVELDSNTHYCCAAAFFGCLARRGLPNLQQLVIRQSSCSASVAVVDLGRCLEVSPRILVLHNVRTRLGCNDALRLPPSVKELDVTANAYHCIADESKSQLLTLTLHDRFGNAEWFEHHRPDCLCDSDSAFDQLELDIRTRSFCNLQTLTWKCNKPTFLSELLRRNHLTYLLPKLSLVRLMGDFPRRHKQQVFTVINAFKEKQSVTLDTSQLRFLRSKSSDQTDKRTI